MASGVRAQRQEAAACVSWRAAGGWAPTARPAPVPSSPATQSAEPGANASTKSLVRKSLIFKMIGMALIPPKKKTTSVGKDAEKRNASSPGGSRGNGRAPPQKGDVTRQVHSGSAPADLSAGARASNCTTLSAARLTAATGGSDPSGRRRATSHTHRGLFLPRNIHGLESEGRADTGYDREEPRAPCSTWRPPGTRGRMPCEPT